MAYEGLLRVRCAVCHVSTSARYDESLVSGREFKARLEHVDDDVHNIVPMLDGQRCHPMIVLEPDVEQLIAIQVLD